MLEHQSLIPLLKDYIEQNNTSIVKFTRLKEAEGIEDEKKDFAEEVAEQLK